MSRNNISTGITSECPLWLTSSFIQNAVKETFSVETLEIENAVEAGDNYATVVYRALAKTSLGPMSFIVKSIPRNKFRANYIKNNQMMTREVQMYKTTLPLLKGTTESLNYPNFVYYNKDENCESLVLQDLGPLGYRTRPRQLGLDVAHCRLALKELAHLHGLSAVLRIQQPEVFKSKIHDLYKDIKYSESSRENTDKIIHTILPSIAESVRLNLPFRFNTISKIMDSMLPTAFENIKNDINEAYLPENKEKLEDIVLVLNHGDFWCNNILFKYPDKSDTPVACTLIDFQISRCASPSLDLHNFFYSSTTQATRRAYMDELLQLYLDEANIILRSKGVTDPGKKFYKSVSEIKDDMQRHSNSGFLISCIVLPMVIADKSTVPNLNEVKDNSFMIKNQNPFSKMYSGTLFVSRFIELLEDFDNLGYFEQRIKYSK